MSNVSISKELEQGLRHVNGLLQKYIDEINNNQEINDKQKTELIDSADTIIVNGDYLISV